MRMKSYLDIDKWLLKWLEDRSNIKQTEMTVFKNKIIYSLL